MVFCCENCSSDQEKLLLRPLEQFLKQDIILTCYWMGFSTALMHWNN